MSPAILLPALHNEHQPQSGKKVAMSLELLGLSGDRKE
jgi:hypothetical protein